MSLFWPVLRETPTVTVVSDASGTWGCGAYWGNHWFQLQWPSSIQQTSIQVKEFIPLIVATVLFGHQWANQVVQFQVDNQVMVDVISSTYSRNSYLMHLIRLLVFFAAKYSFWFTATRVLGKSNYLADALSRNNLPPFLSQVPEASPQSPSIPEDLVTLMSQDVNWDIHSLGPSSTVLFSCTECLHPQDVESTKQLKSVILLSVKVSQFALSQPLRVFCVISLPYWASRA